MTDKPEAADNVCQAGAADHVESGRSRALRLLADLKGAKGSAAPAEFARIVIGLFPEWFDFAPEHFAILTSRRYLYHLIVTGDDGDLIKITTSNSRCMGCLYLGDTSEFARMDMHYEPFPEQLEKARDVILLAFHRLFPKNSKLPEGLALLDTGGRVFPERWDGKIRVGDAELKSPSIVPPQAKPWWRVW